MKNAKFNTHKVKNCCENKLGIQFPKSRSKHFTGWFKIGKIRATRITVPKGRKEIKRKTYESMAEQLKLSVEEFDNLIDCFLKKGDYEKILSEK